MVCRRIYSTTRPSRWKPSVLISSNFCSQTSPRGWSSSGGIFDFDARRSRLEEITRQLEAPDIWNDPQKAQELGREKKQLDNVVINIIS
ncbi:MAG: hypothetical protein ACKODB_12175, partial [Betaproteobacteria bacterium]